MAPEGSPDPWVPAVLQDAIGEEGFLSECDDYGHVAWWVAEKQLRKAHRKHAVEENHWGTVWGGVTQASTIRQTADPKATSSADLISL